MFLDRIFIDLNATKKRIIKIDVTQSIICIRYLQLTKFELRESREYTYKT